MLILLAVAATYVVPAGEYTRYTDEATNRTLVEAGSFHYVESHPVSFLTVPALIYREIVKAASTVTFILIIGGSFEIITSTGILTVLCKKMAKPPKEAPKEAPVAVDYVAECEKELKRTLGRGVRIVDGKRKGHIELEYYGQDDLQQLYDALHTIRKKEQH